MTGTGEINEIVDVYTRAEARIKRYEDALKEADIALSREDLWDDEQVLYKACISVKKALET